MTTRVNRGLLYALACAALSVSVVLAGGAGPATAAGSACPTTNPPNELVLASGSGQTAQLGKTFQQSLQVKLANTNGCPLTGNLAGIDIDFAAPSGGASGLFASTGSRVAVVGTDAQGIATAPPLTANHTAGSYSVDAQSDYGSVNLSLTNTASGVPAAIAASGATGQAAAINTLYEHPLQARVTDASGNPVQGATVSFAVTPGATGAGASFLGGGQATATTDSDGLATSPPLLANGTSGRFTATASTEGLSTVATYALDNQAAALAISATGDTRLRASVNTRYRQSLRVRVVDASGQPIEGASVTFAIAAAGSGATASFRDGTSQATATTGSDGLAVSPPLTASKTAGTFTATASTPGGAEPVDYTLTNVAGAPATITAGAASGQSTIVRTRFSIPLAVTVSDKDGNPVAGARVTFIAPTRGPSGHFGRRGSAHVARATTNRNGIAVAPTFKANAKPGGYTVTVTVRGSSRRVAFALVNQPRS